MSVERLPHDLAHALGQARDRLPSCLTIAWYPEVASTNDVALACAQAGAPEGLVVVADVQVRGRGRLGRNWSSPAGAGIYASIVLRPLAHAPLLTIAAGVAAAEGIEAATGLQMTLKWPNDLYAWSASSVARKAGGILAEGGTSTAAGAFVVVGIGINVRRAAYPPDVALRATSLEDELGREIDRWLVLVASLEAFWRHYAELQSGHTDALLRAWSSYASPTLGRPVEWDAGGVGKSGIAEGIEPDGALRVRTARGISRIISGEVRWIS